MVFKTPWRSGTSAAARDRHHARHLRSERAVPVGDPDEGIDVEPLPGGSARRRWPHSLGAVHAILTDSTVRSNGAGRRSRVSPDRSVIDMPLSCSSVQMVTVARGPTDALRMRRCQSCPWRRSVKVLSCAGPLRYSRLPAKAGSSATRTKQPAGSGIIRLPVMVETVTSRGTAHPEAIATNSRTAVVETRRPASGLEMSLVMQLVYDLG